MVGFSILEVVADEYIGDSYMKTEVAVGGSPGIEDGARKGTVDVAVVYAIENYVRH